MKTEKIDSSESRMFEQVRELCVLCAKGIVKISDDTGINPKLIAKFFIEVFQKIIGDMESDTKV